VPVGLFLCTFFEFCAKTVAYSIKTAIFAGLFLFSIPFLKNSYPRDKKKAGSSIRNKNYQSYYINYKLTENEF